MTMITAARVADLHAASAVIGTSIPASSVAKPGCVDGAINNAHQVALYDPTAIVSTDDNGLIPEPNPLLVAAYLLRSLAVNHCYSDGNKRVAWLAALDVLEAHAHVTINAGQEEAAGFVLQVTTGNLEVHDIAEWLAAHVVPSESAQAKPLENQSV